MAMDETIQWSEVWPDEWPEPRFLTDEEARIIYGAAREPEAYVQEAIADHGAGKSQAIYGAARVEARKREAERHADGGPRPRGGYGWTFERAVR